MNLLVKYPKTNKFVPLDIMELTTFMSDPSWDIGIGPEAIEITIDKTATPSLDDIDDQFGVEFAEIVLRISKFKLAGIKTIWYGSKKEKVQVSFDIYDLRSHQEKFSLPYFEVLDTIPIENIHPGSLIVENILERFIKYIQNNPTAGPTR